MKIKKSKFTIAFAAIALLLAASLLSLSSSSASVEEALARTGTFTFALTPHKPIRIIGNAGFTEKNGVVGGSGAKEDPYIIASWEIDAEGYNYGIKIENTDAHFIIKDCKVSRSVWGGIFLENVENGKIIGCEISNNRIDGIRFLDSSNNEVSGNLFVKNQYGIDFGYSGTTNNIVSENIFELNTDMAIFMWSASHNKIYKNTISGSFLAGIYLKKASNNEIFENTIKAINWNGIASYEGASGNLIYHNNLMENYTNAYDEGSNQWDNGSEGNYWDDYTGKDADGDGIGDTPHRIFGPFGADNKDRYPLMQPFVNNTPSASDTRPQSRGEGHIMKIKGVRVEIDEFLRSNSLVIESLPAEANNFFDATAGITRFLSINGGPQLEVTPENFEILKAGTLDDSGAFHAVIAMKNFPLILEQRAQLVVERGQILLQTEIIYKNNTDQDMEIIRWDYMNFNIPGAKPTQSVFQGEVITHHAEVTFVKLFDKIPRILVRGGADVGTWIAGGDTVVGVTYRIELTNNPGELLGRLREPQASFELKPIAWEIGGDDVAGATQSVPFKVPAQGEVKWTHLDALVFTGA